MFRVTIEIDESTLQAAAAALDTTTATETVLRALAVATEVGRSARLAARERRLSCEAPSTRHVPWVDLAATDPSSAGLALTCGVSEAHRTMTGWASPSGAGAWRVPHRQRAIWNDLLHDHH